MTNPVSFTIEDGVGLLTLDSPPANALSTAMIDGLNAACESFDTGDVGCVVFTSALERFFAAGADLKLLVTLDATGFASYLTQLRGVLDRIAAAEWLSIAAIDGLSLGGGLELSMACTFRVVSPRAQLGVPEVKLGLLPGAGGTQRLPWLIGRAAALDMLTTGDPVDGEQAFKLGLADRCVETPLAEAQTWARELAAGPRAALVAIVRCVDAAQSGGDGMAVEGAEVSSLFQSADGREGIAAFIERRTAHFGRATRD